MRKQSDTTATDDAIYISVVSGHFDAADGSPRFVPEGARLRANDEAVARFPEWFCADGATDLEMNQKRHALASRTQTGPFA